LEIVRLGGDGEGERDGCAAIRSERLIVENIQSEVTIAMEKFWTFVQKVPIITY
jgi:hypothetical protein